MKHEPPLELKFYLELDILGREPEEGKKTERKKKHDSIIELLERAGIEGGFCGTKEALVITILLSGC